MSNTLISALTGAVTGAVVALGITLSFKPEPEPIPEDAYRELRCGDSVFIEMRYKGKLVYTEDRDYRFWFDESTELVTDGTELQRRFNELVRTANDGDTQHRRRLIDKAAQTDQPWRR